MEPRRVHSRIVSLKLYVKSWCSWCISARQYLNNRGFKYQELDVNKDPAAYDEMIRISGQRFTPTLDADGLILADFGTDELEIFLKQHSITP
jgi:glutaredoxin